MEEITTNNNELCIGRVCEIRKNTFMVRYENKELKAALRGSFYKDGTDIPVVGDYVKFIPNDSGTSMIYEVCERKSILYRPSQSGHSIEFVKHMVVQVMVANIDYAFIVASLNANYNFNRIARYVSIAIQGNAIPVVILTKSDLCSNPGRYISEIEALSDKVRVHAVSALLGIGLEEINEYCTPGTTIALIGSSGVGKSTLINAIAGKEIMETSEIREEDAKGRHTTTHRQMIFLDNGVAFIDTPGMREIGLFEVEEGLNDTFSDVIEVSSHCKFNDCRHENEPGCAIKAAIESGELSEERYKLYMSLQKENRASSSLRGKKSDKMILIAKNRRRK